MAGLRPFAALTRNFGAGRNGSDGTIPHGAVPAYGNTPTALVGAYATSITSTSVAFRWTGGGNTNGGANPLWIASPSALSMTGNYAFITAPTYNGTDYGGLSITGLTTGTQYTYYLWVSTDNGDGAVVSVTFTTL